MKLTTVLMLFVLGLLSSRTTMRADSLTPGFFTTIEVPGALPGSTSVNAISSSGNLAGRFSDSTGDHGFIDNHGVFTTFDAPVGAGYFEVTGVNDAGEVAGNYSLPDESFTSGFRYANGVFSPLTYPNGSGRLFAHGINNAGEIVGETNSCTVELVCTSGFVYSKGNVTTYRFPVPEPYTADTSFAGINNHDNVVGTYRAGIEHHGYSYSGGFIDSTRYNVSGAMATFPTAINDSNKIVGSFVDTSSYHFFLDSNGSVSELSFQPTGISNSDQIVGGGDFVFTATPEPASLVLFGSGLVAIGIAMRRKRNGR